MLLGEGPLAPRPKSLVVEGKKSRHEDCHAPITEHTIAHADGPTLPHGGMKYGCGSFAAKRNGAKEIVDPRQYAVGSIKVITKLNRVLDVDSDTTTLPRYLQETYEKYPNTGTLVSTVTPHSDAVVVVTRACLLFSSQRWATVPRKSATSRQPSPPPT